MLAWTYLDAIVWNVGHGNATFNGRRRSGRGFARSSPCREHMRASSVTSLRGRGNSTKPRIVMATFLERHAVPKRLACTVACPLPTPSRAPASRRRAIVPYVRHRWTPALRRGSRSPFHPCAMRGVHGGRRALPRPATCRGLVPAPARRASCSRPAPRLIPLAYTRPARLGRPASPRDSRPRNDRVRECSKLISPGREVSAVA